MYAILELNGKLDALKLPDGAGIERFSTVAPETSDRVAMKWDGEWQITYEVFRDLGIAFAVVLALIAVLVVGWLQSFHGAARDPAPDPSLAHRHPAGPLGVRCVLHRHLDDRLHRRGGHHRAELDHPRGLHRAEGAPGNGSRRAVVEAGAVASVPCCMAAAAVVVGSSVMLSTDLPGARRSA